MKLNKWVIIIFVLSVLDSVKGQAPKYSNDFMYIGVDAKAMALGNAVQAGVNDLTAGYWNPAGLVRIPHAVQLGFMHAEYFAGIAKYDYIAAAFPFDSNKNALGISVIRFAVDDIPNTLELVEPDGSINYDNVKSFSVGDYGILLSYARKFGERFSAGGNVKVIHHKAGDFAKSWGFGLDLGAQYFYNDWRFGVSLKDITSTFNAWSYNFTEEEKEVFELTDNVIPENSLEVTTPRINIAAGYYKAWKKIELNTEINIDITTDGKRNTLFGFDPLSFDPHLGVEVGFANTVYVRSGINNIQKQLNQDGTKKVFTLQPNVGVGLRIKTISIDYAFTDPGLKSQSNFSHVVSAKIGINKKDKE